jgi:uncharacterized protein (TIGR03032 family)
MADLIPFGKFLEDNNCSLLVSTYKSNLVLGVTSRSGQVETSAWPMPRPMGICRVGNGLAIGTESVIVQYTNEPSLAGHLDLEEGVDALFMKRSLHITGDINIHDLGSVTKANDETEIWFVNTRFSCLATLQDGYSFVPRWKPSWISSLVGDDRCHLNGLAMVEGKPKYASAFSQTDSKQGWREGESDSGVIVDVETGEIVASGIHHPHSPTWYRNALFVLESGTGSLCRVDTSTKHVTRIASLSGYVRGLSFIDGYAIVGLSKVRQTNSSKVELKEEKDPKAGIGIVDISSGAIVSTLRFDEAVSEIYDIEILPGVAKPAFAEHNRTSGSSFVLPKNLQSVFSAKSFSS